MKKYLLYCFLFILLDLFTINLNIVNAVTWEDFIEFGHEIIDYNYVGYSDLTNGLPTLFQYQDNIETYLGDLDSYNGFCFISAYNSSSRSYYYLVYGISYTSNTSIICSSSSVSISNCSWKKLDSYSSFTQPSVSTSSGNFNLSGTINRLYFLVDNTWVSNWYTWIGNNRYNGVVQRLDAINSDNTILFDSLLGKYWFTDTYSWQLFSGDTFVTNLIDYDNTLTENYDNIGFQLVAENQDLIITNYNYNVRLFVNDTLKYKSNNYTIYNFYNNNGSNSSNIGDITNSSGEVTGNVNLNDLPKEIGKVFYNSGDSGDKGIVQKIYEDLFTLDSGDVQDIYKNLSGKIDSGDTPLVVFSPFLDVLRNEPGDFIISWNNIPLHLTFNDGEDLINTNFISGDSINFSALARNNDTIGVLKFWINTILAFSIFTMITLDLYKLVLRALGVTTDFVNDMDQDEETTVLYNSVSQSSTLDTKTGELKPRPVVYTTTKSTRRRL